MIISVAESSPCFAGEQAEFELRLRATGRRPRENIQLSWAGSTPQTVDVIDQTQRVVKIYHPAPQRGLLKPEALLLETYYPLGLLRAWSWIELDTSVVVYPSELSSQIPLPSNSIQGERQLAGLDGGEDFSGLEQYHPGMSLRHIAWKTYARGQGLYAKTYASALDERTWLDWAMFTGIDTETRLSRICYWILYLEKKGEHYGLRLPGVEIEPDRGGKAPPSSTDQISAISGQADMKSLYHLSLTAFLWQFIAIIVAVAPHLSHLPIWIPLMVLCAIGWRLMVHTGRWSFPHWSIRAVFSLAGCFGVFISFGGINDVNGMVALLVVGFGLKSLEIHSRRDALLVVYVAYLVATSTLLFEQGIWVAAYVLISVQVTTAALMALYQSRESDLARPFRSSALMMMQALPLMLVLFIIIPRMGPLWSVKMDMGGARTGLSDQMAPGDITRLTRSSDIAFRVFFDDENPRQRELYWRAMTYSDFDGVRWFNVARDSEESRVAETLYVAESKVSYKVTMEPTRQSYVPSLDLPMNVPMGYKMQPDMTLRSDKPFTDRRDYKLTSTINYQLSPEGSVFNYERELRLPLNNPKSRRAARVWYRESGGAEAYIQRLMSFFNAQFIYTLSPPKLGHDGIDQFLFQTQKGFCGHFSGAMVFMLRAVGIPARVVAGYQGGEWNPYEGYLVVRQYDAHAWVEAWLPGQGWVRLDPTAAVAPDRVEYPSDTLFAAQEGFLDDTPFGSFTVGAGGWLTDMRQQWDALTFSWQRWVVNYHLQQNQFLLGLLGAVTPLRVALALLIPFALVLALVALRLLWRSRVTVKDPYDRALDNLSNQLAKSGLGRAPGETIKNYCKRVSDVRPELESELQKIADYYEQMRYAGGESHELGPRLMTLLKQCQSQI